MVSLSICTKANYKPGCFVKEKRDHGFLAAKNKHILKQRSREKIHKIFKHTGEIL